MKILGLFFLLFFSIRINHSIAEQVIESAPLSIQDDGSSARPIVDRKDGTLVIKEEKKEVIQVDPVEVKPESLEELSEDIKKITKSKKKTAKKAASQKSKKTTVSAKRFTEQNTATDELSEIVEPAPLPSEAIQDGQIKLEETPSAIVVAPESSVKSQDGQLKLETIETKIEDKVEPKVEPKQENFSNEEIVIIREIRPYGRYLQFSMGYLNSKYDKIEPSLENGSILTSFRFVADMSYKLQSGFGIELINDKSNQKTPDNIRAIQYRLFLNYHVPLMGSQAFHWLTGIALSVGDYGVKSRSLNSLGEEVHVELGNGLMFGLIPSAGIRFYLAGQSSFDLVVEYHQYIGKPQRHIGGLAFSPVLSFTF